MRRTICIAATVAALALAGGACGSDDKQPAGDQRASGGEATAAGTLQPGAAASPAADPAAGRAATAQATAAAQAQGSGVDPCRVVTKEELEAALGFPLNAGQRGTNVGAECTYKSPRDPNPGTMPTVTVAVFRSRLARPTYDGLRESASPRTTDVPGLGEKAYALIGGGLSDIRELQVLQGDVLFSVNVAANINPPVSLSEEEKRARLIALARTALGRL